jgi:hypothetical protein
MGIVSGLRLASLFVAYAGVGWTGDQVTALMAMDDVPRRNVEVDVAVEIDRRIDRQVRVDVRVDRDGACAVELDRELTIPLDGATLLAIDAGAGELRVEGVDGQTEVHAVGRVCASSEALAEGLQVTLDRVDGELRLSAHYPDQAFWGGRNRTARIDLTVTMPIGTSLDIDDSSGEIVVSGSGALDIDDSSGEILVEGARGSVRIDDSSGEIEVVGATGDVEIEDGSGEIDVRNAEGTVLIRDGSGSIDVTGVGRDVRIEVDGSGSIDVRDVAGSFIVARDGSGGIRYENVAGAVDVPEPERRGRRN